MVLRICTWLSHCNCAWPYSFVAGRLVGVWLSKRPHIPALLFGFIKLHLLLSALFATKWSVPSAKWNQKTKFRFFCSCEIIINNLHPELNPGIRFFWAYSDLMFGCWENLKEKYASLKVFCSQKTKLHITYFKIVFWRHSVGLELFFSGNKGRLK